MESLGSRIRSTRIRRGWSQSQLSSRLGVVQSLVSAWETSRRLPNIDQLRQLSSALDAPVLFLLEGSARLPTSLATLTAELRWYGFDVVGAAEVPAWAVRSPADLLTAALQDPDPRIVDQLPGLLLARDDLSGVLAVAYARERGVRRRLGWIADVARALHRLGLGRHTPGLEDIRLEPGSYDDWDSLGHPASARDTLPPAWKRWRVDYDQSIPALAEIVRPMLERKRDGR